jgi:hypothetical protein
MTAAAAKAVRAIGSPMAAIATASSSRSSRIVESESSDDALLGARASRNAHN